jgi:hypothetical protein
MTAATVLAMWSPFGGFALRLTLFPIETHAIPQPQLLTNQSISNWDFYLNLRFKLEHLPPFDNSDFADSMRDNLRNNLLANFAISPI